MSNLCLSGGADGADLAWGEAANHFGHAVIHWTFAGHRSKAPGTTLQILSPADLALADPQLARANMTLKRRWPVASPHVANLLRRNWFQVATADACYAVSAIDRFGLVKGGTAWAVQLFLDRFDGAPCPCFVFDQSRGVWFRWERRWQAVQAPPAPSGTYAGIGSRDLTEAGLDAILGAY